MSGPTNDLERLCLDLLQKEFGGKAQIDCQVDSLPGTPDFVLTLSGMRLAVFVDGLFWHPGRGEAMLRRSNRLLAEGDIEKAEFWHAKWEDNRTRDRRVNRALRELGVLYVRLKEDKLMGFDPGGYISRTIGNKFWRAVADRRKKAGQAPRELSQAPAATEGEQECKESPLTASNEASKE